MPSDPEDLTELEPLESADLPDLPDSPQVSSAPAPPAAPVERAAGSQQPSAPREPKVTLETKQTQQTLQTRETLESRQGSGPDAGSPSSPSAPTDAVAPSAPDAPDAPDAAVEPVAPSEPVAPAEPAASPESASGERPPLRQLDKAPLHLRKAAGIVLLGSLLPWMGHGDGLVTVLAKAVVLLGAWLWWKQIDHNWGPKLPGLLGKLGDLVLAKGKGPDESAKKSARTRPGAEQRINTLAHPFPTGLHVLSLAVTLVGCVALPFLTGLSGGGLGKLVAELGMLSWAGFTWVHIHNYERWGSFNPIFPMMFLAMLFSGLLQLVTGIGINAEELGGLTKISMIVGGAVVGAGGGFAGWTIVEAMMQAKKEGDAKKSAALEARRAARKKQS